LSPLIATTRYCLPFSMYVIGESPSSLLPPCFRIDLATQPADHEPGRDLVATGHRSPLWLVTGLHAAHLDCWNLRVFWFSVACRWAKSRDATPFVRLKVDWRS
jgi:hypothetical protein